MLYFDLLITQTRFIGFIANLIVKYLKESWKIYYTQFYYVHITILLGFINTRNMLYKPFLTRVKILSFLIWPPAFYVQIQKFNRILSLITNGYYLQEEKQPVD